MTIPAKFSERYKIEDRGYKTPCWIWQMAKWNTGYGTISFTVNGKTRSMGAHVYAYTLRYGPVSKGMRILHDCDQKDCVNWNHLKADTQKKNIRDAIKRGRFQASAVSRNVGSRNPSVKVSAKQVAEIRERYASGRYTHAALAELFNISNSQIGRITRGERWRKSEVAVATVQRFCAYDGKPIVRYRHPCGALENAQAFAKRRFCSNKCRIAASNGRRAENCTPHHGHWRARQAKPLTPCEECGSTNRVERHHLDRNTLNNDPANIKNLCRPCHEKTFAVTPRERPR